VTVASVDGVTDQFQLRQGVVAASAAAAAASARRRQRRRQRTAGGVPSWAPWAEDGGFGFNNPQKSRRKKSRKRKRKRKQKTIFDLLFN